MAPMVLSIASLAVMGNLIHSEVIATSLNLGVDDVDRVADLAAVQVFPAGSRVIAEAGAREEDHTARLTEALAQARTEAEARAKAEVKPKVEEKAGAEAKVVGKETGKAEAEAEAKAKNAEMLDRATAETDARAAEKAEAQKEFDEQLAKALTGLRADTEARAQADLKARADAQAKAKAEAKTKARKEKIRAEAEAKARAEVEAKTKGEAEVKSKTEAEAKMKVAKAKVEADAKATAEAKVKAAAAEQPAKQPDTSSQKDSRQRESMAYGDPHMQNVLGQRFDLMQPGSHTLVLIPRYAMENVNELFRVQAGVQRVGKACADMYIQTLNVTGRWVEARQQQGRLHFSAGEPADRRGTNWMHFGNTLGHLDLKVVYGQTSTGTRYLNFFVRHLGESGYRVGGLLGEDDHTAAAKPDSQCKNVLVLLEGISADRGERARSAAEATLL